MKQLKLVVFVAAWGALAYVIGDALDALLVALAVTGLSRLW